MAGSRGRKARPSRYGKRRAATLVLVYVLMAAHIAHWRVTGRTLAPLELNEVMYTFELGIVTAGFLFMAAAMLASAVFGRFFCSWGCHILALEDAAAWLLARCHVKARPVRSRVLLLVPPLAMLYMFAWPTMKRLLVHRWPELAASLGEAPAFELRVAGDEEQWASFVTSDFWRNLPGPWIAVLTLLICGFLIIYFLGSRTFCTYACPYGAAFSLADRLAPGRIRLSGDCDGCGLCTAGCQSGIRVHEEIARFGMVVSPRCLKDLDCVSVCPLGGLSYGFVKPAGLASLIGKDRPRARHDFSWSEEVLAGLSFLATLLVFRGLYSVVPFLMTLGLGVIIAFLAVWTRRLFTRNVVRFNGATLRLASGLTMYGRAFLTVSALTGILFVHSGLIRYHEARGEAALRRAATAYSDTSRTAERTALRHLRTVGRWGLVTPANLEPKLAALYLSLGQFDDAAASLVRVTKTTRSRFVLANAHASLAGIRALAGDATGTIREFRAALRANPEMCDVHLDLADLLVAQGHLETAETHLRSALSLRPESVRALFNLAVLSGRRGRTREALELLREVERIDPEAPGVRTARDLLGAQGADGP